MASPLDIKRITSTVVTLIVLLIAGNVFAQENIATKRAEVTAISLPVSVSVNKSVVIRLRQKARKVLVAQPEIAEVVLLAPDLVLVNGKAIGATSLVILTEGSTAR